MYKLFVVCMCVVISNKKWAYQQYITIQYPSNYFVSMNKKAMIQDSYIYCDGSIANIYKSCILINNVLEDNDLDLSKKQLIITFLKQRALDMLSSLIAQKNI